MKTLRDNILKQMIDSVSMYDSDCDFSESSDYINNSGRRLSFSIGPVDRGPRTDHGGGDDGDDWLDDNQIDDLSAEYLKKNKRKLDRLITILENELVEYSIDLDQPCIDYGEKGHVMLELSVEIKGKFFISNGVKIWADYSGSQDRKNIVLFTSDKERFFETEDEIEKFLITYKGE